jgi:branched-chain amino acid transport system substrate-binding protein
MFSLRMNPSLTVLTGLMELAIGIGSAQAATPAATTPGGGHSQTIKIGHAGPLTGEIAHIGKDQENGARLAIEDINRSGLVINGEKIHLELDTQDDQSDPRVGVLVAQRLVDDGVVAVVGHFNSGVSIPASSVYKSANIAQVSPGSTNPQYTLQGFPNTFRVVATDAEQAPALARYTIAHLAPKRVAIVDDATQAGKGQADAFQDAIVARGAQVVDREATTDKAVDFRGILTKIKAARPDVIMYGGTDQQAGPLAEQAQELGITAKILGPDGICTQQFADLAGAASKNAICSEPGMPLVKMKQGASFEAKYEARFQQPIVEYAPFAYDAVYVIVEAMKRSNSTQPARIIEALHHTDFEGITGHISFDAKGDLNQTEISIFDFENGKKSLLEVENVGH